MDNINSEDRIRCCPICGSRTFAEFSQEKIDYSAVDKFTYASRKEPEFMCLRLVRCMRCDLVYAPAPPTGDFLQNAYASADYDSEDEANYAANTYAKELFGYVQNLKSRALAIDVGAGNGAFIPWLRSQGFGEVLGIEPSNSAVSSARDDVKPFLINKMYSSELLKEKKVSLACSFMTLEHIDDPMGFVKSLTPSMSEGSMIAVVVHNRSALLNRLLGMRSPIIDIEHLQLFSPKSIEYLLLEAGFNNIEIKSFWNTYPLRYWIRLLPLPKSIKRIILKCLKLLYLDKIKVSLPVGNMLAVGYM